MKKCLHQIIRPKRKRLEKKEGVGECIGCEPNEEENKYCREYCPVSPFKEFEAKK